MPSNVAGTGTVTPSSFASSAAISLRLASVMPRLNVPMTVNGQMSCSGPLLPSGNLSCR